MERHGAFGPADGPVVERDQPAADLQDLRRRDGLDGGALQRLEVGGVQLRSPFMSRALSRCQSRAAVVSRLSCSFLPLASEISSFAIPLSFQ